MVNMATANTVMESMVMGSTVSMGNMGSMVHMVMKISKIPIALRTIGDIQRDNKFCVSGRCAVCDN